MKRRACMLAGAALLLSCAPSVQAGSDGFSVAVKGGTLGGGVEGNLAVNEWLGLRLGVNALQFSMNETIDEVDYDADLRMRNVTALVDFYPFRGIFRLTGGLMYNGNEFELEGRSFIPAVINGHAYTPEELGTLRGKADFDSLAPYVGLGWSSRPENQSGWGLAVDLGVVVQGSPKVTPLTASGTKANDPQLMADLEEERADVLDELDSFKYYPVLSFMVQYSF